MPEGFSSSRKLATLVANIPGVGRTIYQEIPGCTDPDLREAIQAAMAAFWQVYIEKRAARPRIREEK